MTTKTKKEIQKVTEDVLIAALAYLKIEPSKKITKRIVKISKDFSEVLKKEIKREDRPAKSPKVKTAKKKLNDKAKGRGKPK
jgi:hypothetical protein